jgi:hypothetical protein
MLSYQKFGFAGNVRLEILLEQRNVENAVILILDQKERSLELRNKMLEVVKW